MLWPYWCHQIPNHSLQPKKVPAIHAPHLTSRIFHPRFPKTRHLLGEEFHALLSLYTSIIIFSFASGTEVVDAIQSFSVRDGRSGLALCHRSCYEPIGCKSASKKYDTINTMLISSHKKHDKFNKTDTYQNQGFQ